MPTPPRLFLLAVVLASFIPVARGAPAARPPNLVVILLDNIGQEWFGSYGSEEKCTPQMDRLAAAGVRFENCYTPVVCGPSRVQLLTGRYPFRTGWYLHHDAALYGGGGLDPKREITIARVLRDAGYRTGMAGKWQVNHLYQEPGVLRAHGFDESLVVPMSIDRDRADAAFMARYERAIAENDDVHLLDATRRIESRYADPVVMRDGGAREVRRGKFGPDVFQEFAIDFMTRHRDRPFFFYHAMVLAHGANAATHAAALPGETTAPKTPNEAFAAMVRYADRQVGEFFAALDRLGLRDNTIVVVATDNGSDATLSGRRHGRVVKGGLYQMTENGGNVVCFVNSPRLVPGGRTSALIDFSDIFPTLAAFAGAPRPRGVAIDGRSYAEYLRGRAPLPREWIFNQYRPHRVVRDARFKLWGDGRLFDLAADPGEERPVPAGSSAAADAARARLAAALASLPQQDAPLPFAHRSLSAFKQRREAAAKK
ncbi:MAG: sulfatase-like hydrolase/transferase [Opitutaceae bacterium]|nr:sulfatase-like hydrolase/transferase [Opitutaceae bacterium]